MIITYLLPGAGHKTNIHFFQDVYSAVADIVLEARLVLLHHHNIALISKDGNNLDEKINPRKQLGQ